MRSALLAGLLAFPAVSYAALGAESGPCSLEDAAPVEIAAVDENFDFLTGDGRRVALVGVDFPSGEGDSRRREDIRSRLLALFLERRPVFLAAAAPSADRWGRLPAGLFFSGQGREAALVSAGEALIRAGLARFRPDAAAIACRNAFLAAEGEARAGRLGLWASGEYVVVDAGGGRDALLVAKGMTLVEGVVSGIGDSGGSLYLNFGPRRGVDFAVVIWKRNLEAFERAGLRPRMLGGRRVRVRGLIDTRSGPRMEIASPAEIELLDAP